MTAAERMLRLGEELLAKPLACANHANTLLAAVSGSERDLDKAKAAIRALELFFADSLQRGELIDSADKGTTGQTAAAAAHRQWLYRQYTAYADRLLQILAQTAPPAMQVAALAAVLELAKASRSAAFQPKLFSTALQIILCCRHSSADVLAAVSTTYLDYIDVRFYVFKVIHLLARGASQAGGNSLGLSDKLQQYLPTKAQVSREEFVRNLHVLLSAAKPLDAQPAAKPEEDEDGLGLKRSWCGGVEAATVRPCHRSEGSKHRQKRKRLADDEEGDAGDQSKQAVKWMTPHFQRKAFSDAWLAFLRLHLPDDLYKKLLVRLHEDVIPHLSNPLLLADQLSGALDQGGLTGLLALHAIFVLVSKYGLEYPAFYTRLYQLLQPSTLLAKHRARFFRLADVFLSSPLIPAYTVAAFIKRFARLALFAPPAGAVVCLAFVHNLLRRHPACIALLDKPPPEGRAAASSGLDPYLEDVADPAQSRALQSSLWELKTLSRHFYWQVATLADQILAKDLGDRRKTSEVDLGPLVSGSYSSLIEVELARKLRRPRAPPSRGPVTKLFDADCAADFGGWDFSAAT